ncbi:hypothetical protein V3C99_004353, partial [Haemonchus contortus]|uniref:MANEC domain-containing protein n=1 Tax=Haemonchus contortus TaxID=6289 RepID=A0A7I4XXP1_HAECO
VLRTRGTPSHLTLHKKKYLNRQLNVLLQLLSGNFMMLIPVLFLSVLQFSSSCISTGVPGCECQNCACAVARTHPSPVMRPADRSAIVPLAVIHPVAAPSYISSPTPRDPFSQLGNSYTLHSNPPESPFYRPTTEGMRAVESRVFEPEPPSYHEPRKPSAHLTQTQLQESAVTEHSPLPPAYEPTQLAPFGQKNIPVTTSGYNVERPNLIRAPAVPPFQDVGMTNKGITSLSSRGSTYQETFLPVMRMNETTALPPQMADHHSKTNSLGKMANTGIADSRPGMQSGQIQVKSSDLVTEASIYDVPHEKAQQPLFITYYNQECSGLMVRMVHGKSIVAATEECLKIGCEAINAQSLPDYAYMYQEAPKQLISNEKPEYLL